VKENQLVVSGKLKEETDESRYLHRGIAGRAFERRFQLADYIRVDGARLVNGLLQIDLVREIPEALKPRTIKIETKAKAPTIEHKAA
jgi:molecular chaperone IbpA